MKKLIQTLSLCLLASLFIGGTQVNAQSGCADNSCRWDGCFRVGAELLYWRPCVCGWSYGERSPNPNPANQSQALILHSEPDFGFRIFGGYDTEDGCGFANLSWTYLRANDTAFHRVQTDGSLIIGPYTGVEQGEVGLKFEYNRVALRLGQYLYQTRCANFYAYAGADFVEIDSKRSIDLLQGTTSLTRRTLFEKSEFYSMGLELGVGGEYAIGCGINLVGRVGGLALVGRRKHTYSRPREGQQTHYPAYIHCVPGLDVRLGLGWARECGCMEYAFEIGYALEHYFNVISANADRLTTTSSCHDVGFAGPYASFQVRF